MSKKSSNADRRAAVERMRHEQQRKERLRSLALFGVVGIAVVALLAAALIPYIKSEREDARLAALPIENIGVGEKAAGCQPVKTADAQGSNVHVASGTKITYADAPPAFGKHWGNFMTAGENRAFFTIGDRPRVERLVHSLEHGHTIVWYDDTLKPGTRGYADLRRIAAKLGDKGQFIAAPWKATDGHAFPTGTHVALTHWTGPEKQRGIWEYCAAPSGAVTKKFMTDYPKSDSPEGYAY